MWKKFLFITAFLLLACSALIPISTSPPRTPLPTLTPTPRFNRWDATQVMRAIRSAGLDYEEAHVMAPKEYGAIPPLASQSVHFSLPSLCSDCTGIVLSFSDPAAMESTKTYYVQADNDTGGLSAWVFEKDNILLHLSGELPEPYALQYGAVLVRLDR